MFDVGLDERPPDRHLARAPRPELRGADRDGRARPPGARASGSGTPSCPTRSATRSCWPRPRRSWTTPPAVGSSSGSGRAGTRASTCRSASRCRRCPSGSTASSRPSTSSGRCGRAEAATPPGVTRPDPFYPLERRDQRAAAADAGRPAAVAGRPEATRHRPRRGRRRRLGAARPSSPSGRRRTSSTSARSATAILAALDGHRPRPGDVRDQRPDPDRRRPPQDRAWALDQAPRGRRARRDPRHPRHAAAARARPGSTPSPATSPSRCARRSADDRGRHAPAGHDRRRPGGVRRDRQRGDAGVDPTSVEEQRWADGPIPAASRFLAEQDGRVVGAASVGRIFMYRGGLPALLGVDRRRCGGSPAGHRQRAPGAPSRTTRRRPARRASRRGRSTIDPRASTSSSIAGFRELERARMVRLDLGGLRPPVGGAAGRSPD